jgi:ribosomal protein S18 acetylase RimI-like enzyme
VRRAEASDEASWARVWDESARAGFGPFLPEGHVFPEVSSDLMQSLLADPAVTLLMAEEDGEALGYCTSGESRDPDASAAVGEVRTLFVAPAAWRRGAGSALMAAALDDLRERGYSEATVWSFADNERANRFYEGRGFERDGADRTEEEWADAQEVRYRRRL